MVYVYISYGLIGRENNSSSNLNNNNKWLNYMLNVVFEIDYDIWAAACNATAL